MYMKPTLSGGVLCPIQASTHSIAFLSPHIGSGSPASLSLTEVQNPQDGLAKASVQDNQGTAIGPVHDVVLGSNGKPTAVNVDVGTFLGTGSKVIAIKAVKLKCQQDKNVLVTTMTKEQIKAPPQAKGV